MSVDTKSGGREEQMKDEECGIDAGVMPFEWTEADAAGVVVDCREGRSCNSCGLQGVACPWEGGTALAALMVGGTA